MSSENDFFNLTVADYMIRNLITLRPSDGIYQAVGLFVTHHISGIPVVNEAGRLVGLLTEHDCLPVFYDANYHHHHSGLVSDYMVSDLQTMTPQMSLILAVDTFLNSPYRRFPVVEKGRLVGLISRKDLMRALKNLADHDLNSERIRSTTTNR